MCIYFLIYSTGSHFTFAFVDDQMMNNPTIARKFILLGSTFNHLLHNDFSNIPITFYSHAIVIQYDHYNIPNVIATHFISIGFTSFKVIVKKLVELEFTCFGSIFTCKGKRGVSLRVV